MRRLSQFQGIGIGIGPMLQAPVPASPRMQVFILAQSAGTVQLVLQAIVALSQT